MHSEHITNLHPGWVAGGWLVAIAVAGLVFLALVGTGLLPREGAGEVVGSAVAIGAGFFAGGFFVGLRWSDAPILHGVAITLLSVVVTFASVVFAPGLGGGMPGGTTFVLGTILLQLVASVLGGWTGRTMVRSGATPDPTAMPPEA
jgi:hypothetical protein